MGNDTKKSIRGPGGILVKLDRNEVYPDDPGNGTPAIVQLFQYTATFWCASGEGELTDERGQTRQLSTEQLDWLDSVENQVDQFLYANRPES